MSGKCVCSHAAGLAGYRHCDWGAGGRGYLLALLRLQGLQAVQKLLWQVCAACSAGVDSTGGEASSWWELEPGWEQ